MTTTVAELFTEGHRASWINPASRTSAEATTGWLSMRDYHKFVAFIQCGLNAANATVDFTIYQATDDAGTGAKVVTGKAITTLGNANDNVVAAIELDSSELDVTGNFDWINVQMLVGGAAACLTAALCFRYQPRFKPVGVTNLQEVVN